MVQHGVTGAMQQQPVLLLLSVLIRRMGRHGFLLWVASIRLIQHRLRRLRVRLLLKAGVRHIVVLRRPVVLTVRGVIGLMQQQHVLQLTNLQAERIIPLPYSANIPLRPRRCQRLRAQLFLRVAVLHILVLLQPVVLMVLGVIGLMRRQRVPQ